MKLYDFIKDFFDGFMTTIILILWVVFIVPFFIIASIIYFITQGGK